MMRSRVAEQLEALYAGAGHTRGKALFDENDLMVGTWRAQCDITSH